LRDHLSVKNNHLFIDDFNTVELAEKYNTPLFVTSATRIKKNFDDFKRAFPDAEIYYAAKANWNVAILKILAERDAGADVFSDGELYVALKAGIPRDKILFNGNSKSERELRMAVEEGVKVSVDSLDELRALSKIASEMGKEIKIAFRVNPDISSKTHPKIATGLKQSKFGIPYEEILKAYEMALKLPGVIPAGIHCHIGSQILELSPFEEMMERMMKIARDVIKLGVELEFVDVGGGLGIPYSSVIFHRRFEDRMCGLGSVEVEIDAPTPYDLAKTILPIFDEKRAEMGADFKLILEPGRYIVGDSTVLLSRVNAVKKAYKNFVAIDAGFNLLIRPVLYDAYHEILVANKAGMPPEETYDIVGPICESGDIMGRNRRLPRVERGDLIAILDAGAYGFSMSSQYNGRVRAAEILVEGNKCAVIRERETYEDLLRRMKIPEEFL